MDEFMFNLLRILGVLGLVLTNAVFVAAELSLVKIRDTQIEGLVRKGNRRAKVVRELIHNLDSTISAIQFGVTLASMGLGVLVEPVFLALLKPVFLLLPTHSHAAEHFFAILSGFFVNSFLLIVIGELPPKAIAIRHTLTVALWTAQPVAFFARMTKPIVWLLHHSAQWLLRRLGISPHDGPEGSHSEEELRLLLRGSENQSGSSRTGHDLVLNALDLRRRIVRDVMRPRQEITFLDTTANLAECLDVAEKTRFSRFPLCEGGDLDKTLGVVHIKDLYALRLRVRSGQDLKPVARKLIYVPETARLEKLLQLLLDRRLHFAIVIDEFGGTVGMATLENILEELVGQIQDEFDQEKPLMVKLDADTWELAGNLPLHELAELVQESLNEEGITSVSGWVTHRLGGFPKRGDLLKLGAYELTVEFMDGMKVGSLKLHRPPAPAVPSSDDSPEI